jgi:N-acetylglucosaminyl-diphospho-decaprenol L-rhamnosyltransferase
VGLSRAVPAAEPASVAVRAPATVGVAIVSYNSARVLPACLASLRAQGPAVQVTTVVVDNGSADGTAALIRAGFPEVRVIEAPRNGGFSYGTNLGLRALGLLDAAPAGAPLPFDYVLFLNPDTALPAAALDSLVRLLRERPALGAVSPLLVRADGTPDWACHRGFPTAWNAACHVLGLDRRWARSRLFGGYNLSYLPLDRATLVDSVAGAFMLVRAAAVQQVGAWDEDYFAYGEDIDYCLRLRRAGWRVWYEPGVRVLHLKGEASKQRSLQMLREFYRAMLVYYRKHHAPHDALPLRLAVSWGIRALYAAALLRQRARPAAKRWVGAARPVRPAE